MSTEVFCIFAYFRSFRIVVSVVMNHFALNFKH